MTIPRFHTAPLTQKGLRAFAFATVASLQLLTSPLSHTPCPVFQNVRQDSVSKAPLEPCLAVARWFQALFTPFYGFFSAFPHGTMRHRTQRVFRLGSICLPSSHGISEPWYSSRPTPYGLSPTGLSPSTAERSSSLRLAHLGANGAHHIPTCFRKQVRTGLCRFPSPVLTASRLLSFPPGTKMFQFPGFPLPAGSLAWPSLTHSGIRGSKAACASPRLIAACHALRRLLSQAIHHLASVCTVQLATTNL